MTAALLGLAALAAAAWVLVGAARTPIPVRASPARPRPTVWRGAYHVHTDASHDGRGTLDEVAQAARRSGLSWVIVTDHNRIDLPGPEYRHGVLLVHGVESSTRPGHLVLIGSRRGLERAERRGDEPLRRAAELGAVAIAAHPLNRRRPFRALDDASLDGLEVYSLNDTLREALRSPPNLVRALLAYPANRVLALRELLHDPTPGLQLWDLQLASGRRLVGACALDAHGWPAYDVAMRTLSMHVDTGRPASGDARADARGLIEGLAAGRAHCSIEAEAPGGGFRLVAREETTGRIRLMGEDVSLEARPVLQVEFEGGPPPFAFTPRLSCGGHPVALTGTQDGRVYEHRPHQSGACRAEVWLREGGRQRIWLLSNPIFVQ